jgi:hypothetical protein
MINPSSEYLYPIEVGAKEQGPQMQTPRRLQELLTRWPVKLG